jgi:hypothetical protein
MAIAHCGRLTADGELDCAAKTTAFVRPLNAHGMTPSSVVTHTVEVEMDRLSVGDFHPSI